jgi:hypothetical protein
MSFITTARSAGGAYVMKSVVSAALLGQPGGSRDVARDAVLRLSTIATADTMHFGEVFVTTRASPGAAPSFSARVATPHVWEGMLFYLSAMALSSPGAFDPERTELPLPPAGVSTLSMRGGCAIATEHGEGALLAAAAFLLFVCLARRRRSA